MYLLLSDRLPYPNIIALLIKNHLRSGGRLETGFMILMTESALEKIRKSGLGEIRKSKLVDV